MIASDLPSAFSLPRHGTGYPVILAFISFRISTGVRRDDFNPCRLLAKTYERLSPLSSFGVAGFAARAARLGALARHHIRVRAAAGGEGAGGERWIEWRASALLWWGRVAKEPIQLPARRIHPGWRLR